jgi:hypothetical protein
MALFEIDPNPPMNTPIDFTEPTCTVRAMHLSTAHAPSEEALRDEKFGPIYEGKGGFGCIYFVPENLDDLHEIDPPAWIFPILAHALEFNYDYVLLDGDGPVLKNFKIYPW